FLKRQWQDGPEQHRITYARQFFDALLAQLWSAEYEDEALALLDKLSEAEDLGARLFAQVEALHRLTDRMVAARYDTAMKKVEHREKRTRTELRDKQNEARRLARTEFADRLHKAVVNRADALAPWLIIERLYLETLLERDLAKVAAECWEFLGARPA